MVFCLPVSMVTRSNDLPLADVKAPSLVNFSRIGPMTLQGPHQLSDRRGQLYEGFSAHKKTRTLRGSLL